MRFLHWFAALILAVELPVPIYWLVMHGGIGYWRKRDRGRLPYWVAVGAAWGLGGWLLYHFLRPRLFAATDRPVWAVVIGAAMMLADVAIFAIAESELGGRRLVGQAELAARGELAVRGLYAHMRHPRHLGMMLGVLGVCVLAGSQRLWIARRAVVDCRAGHHSPRRARAARALRPGLCRLRRAGAGAAAACGSVRRREIGMPGRTHSPVENLTARASLLCFRVAGKRRPQGKGTRNERAEMSDSSNKNRASPSRANTERSAKTPPSSFWARTLTLCRAPRLRPCSPPSDEGAADFIIAPLENSLAGSVYRCYDLLLESKLQHYRRSDSAGFAPSRSARPAPGSNRFAPSSRIPWRWRNARDFLSSTRRSSAWSRKTPEAACAEIVRARPIPSRAAIAGRRAAEVYGGAILQSNLEDHRQQLHALRAAVRVRCGAQGSEQDFPGGVSAAPAGRSASRPGAAGANAASIW